MDDVRFYAIDVDHLGNPVFRITRQGMKNRMALAQNMNPTQWTAVPLSQATSFHKRLIGYCFQDGEIRWDAEFIIHHGLADKSEVELPVHLLMYSPQYPLHLRKHLAFYKHQRSVDRKKLVVQKASPQNP